MLALFSIQTRKPGLGFWSPLVLSLNWFVLSFTTWWTPPDELIFLIGLGITSLVSISIFTISRTRSKYNKLDTRNGVIFVGIGQAALAGFFVGLMISAPILLAGLIFDIAPQFFFDIGATPLVSMPITGCFIGGVIGFILGFICDIIVGFDFRNRPRARENTAIR